MSLAQLFYLKETFRENLRRWRRSKDSSRRPASCFETRNQKVKTRNSIPRSSLPFALESLEPRVLLSAAPVAVSDTYTVQQDSPLVAGTVLIADVNPAAPSSNAANLTNVNGTVFFTATDGINGTELWKTDGTLSGTVMVKDIAVGSGSSDPANLISLNGLLFFTAFDGVSGRELWKSDGTSAGTVLVKDISAGSGSSAPGLLTNLNGTLFFRANDGVNGFELWKSDGTAAGTVLVKDIRAGSDSSAPANLTNVNGTLFFVANDGVTGPEIWKSDGTASGTVLVKDLLAGISPPVLDKFINVNGTLFFEFQDTGVSGRELWKSDGTAAGTKLVKDIRVGTGSSQLSNLINMNDTLFFSADDGVNGVGLWKSDGTEAGTVLVKGNNMGFANPVNMNGTLFFRGNDSIHGVELWKSDGTAAGTVLVKDIVSGSGSASPGNLTDVYGTVFFTATDPTNGTELWRSDGTDSGTKLVADINPGGGSSAIASLVNVYGTLFFSANNGVAGQELWAASIAPGVLANDSDEDGPALSAQLVTGPSNGSLTLNSDGTFIYRPNAGFVGADNFSYQVTDGTSTSNVVAVTLLVNETNVPPVLAPIGNKAVDEETQVTFTAMATDANVVPVNGLTFSLANGTNGQVAAGASIDPVTGVFTWTPTETQGPGLYTFDVVVTDNGIPALSDRATISITVSEVPQAPVAVNDGYTIQQDAVLGGTALVKDIDSTDLAGGPDWLTDVNGTLFFAADNGINGYELWKSDGTEAGTVLVQDILAGSGSGAYGALTNVNGTLFFTADDGVNGAELWKSDGTAAGTVLVKDINLGDSSTPQSLTNVGGTLFFWADDGEHGFELWKSDGTETGTVLVKDLVPGSIGVTTWDFLTDVNGTLFFSANDGVSGTELWKSDGTEAGTVLVKNIRSSSGSSFPNHLTNVNGTVFFGADNGVNGRELWKSDGTAAGTVLVKDIFVGSNGSVGGPFVNVNGTIFFNAYSPESGMELWKSDGTALGTVLVKNINPDGESSDPQSLMNVGGTLFFWADDGVHGHELWKSDGTSAGTVLVKDIVVGSDRSEASLMTSEGETLFFAAFDGVHGYELWRSDGSEAGTVLVKDIMAGSDSSDIYGLTNVNGTLFFVATDGVTGYGLWASHPAPNVLANDTDAEGSALTAQLVTGPLNGTVVLELDGRFSYTPSAGFTGTDTFTYQASDGALLSNIATVTITVTNDPPVVNPAIFSLAEGSANGTPVGTPITFAEPNSGQTHIFAITAGNVGNAFTIDPSTGQLTVQNSGALDFDTTPTFTLTVQVTDNGTPVQYGTAVVTINLQDVANLNIVPIVGGDPVFFETPTGTTVNATSIATPADPPPGVEFPVGTFSLSVSGVAVGGATAVTLTLPTGTVVDSFWKYGPEPGDSNDHWYNFAWDGTTGAVISGNVITLTFVDGARGDADLTANGTILDPGSPVLVVNQPPVITSAANVSAPENQTAVTTVTAMDADLPAQVLTFSLIGGADQTKFAITAGGVLSFVTAPNFEAPTDSNLDNVYEVTVQVHDNSGGIATQILNATVTNVNEMPVLDLIGNKSVNEEVELRFAISGSDVDVPEQTLVYSATGLPAGATFTAATRTFSWTPTEAQGPSSYQVTFSVTDGVVTTSEAVTITVSEVNVAPVLALIGNKTVDEGSLLTFTATATDVDLPFQALTYSLAAGAPAGATINATTGVFTWTPLDGPGASPYNVTVQVTDGVVMASQMFTITVLNVAPTATLTLPTAVAGVDLTFSGVINDAGPGDTLQVSWNFGDGTSTPFQTAARGTVTTTKQYATAGTYTVTLSVRDQNGAQTSVSGSLTVGTIGLIADPCDLTKTALVVNGTSAGDNISIGVSGLNYTVTINGQLRGTFAIPTGHIIINGLDGGDNISIASTITTPTMIFGGAGGDNITGGAGPNLIVGGASSGDNLTGGAGRDILIGGSGGDNLSGNGGDDILIAGTTAYDTNFHALCAIKAEWLRTDRTYAQRRDALLNGGGLNGTFRLNATTVFDDAVGDNLNGNAGTDWFFAKLVNPAKDNVNSVTGETITAQGPPPSPLLAEGGVRAEEGARAALTEAQLAPIVEAARAQWLASGLTVEQAATLSSLQFAIADLDGATLGLSAGTSVLIDRTAAGREWFIDPTPQDHAEFRFVRGLGQWIADAHSPASGRMDLMTTVLHEMGHVLGFDDQAAHQRHANLMTETLPTGVRRTILTDLLAAGPIAPSVVQEHLALREGLTERFLARSLPTDIGAWRLPGNGHGQVGTKSAPLQFDWCEDEEERSELREQTVLKMGPSKTSWLSRFLFQTGSTADGHDHSIEVVLPGKEM